MLTNDDLLETLLLECDTCIHLFGQIPEDGLDYRPSSGQRSLLELLRYLSFSGIGFVTAVTDGEWETYTAGVAAAEKMSAAEFPDAMRRQKEQLQTAFAALAGADLAARKCTLPWGAEMSVARGLLMLPLRSMAAYRMQLFLYIKAAGNDEIWTPDCWAGVSMEKPTPDTDTSEAGTPEAGTDADASA